MQQWAQHYMQKIRTYVHQYQLICLRTCVRTYVRSRGRTTIGNAGLAPPAEPVGTSDRWVSIGTVDTYV